MFLTIYMKRIVSYKISFPIYFILAYLFINILGYFNHNDFLYCQQESQQRPRNCIWVISPSHSKNMLVLVKIAILQSLSFLASISSSRSDVVTQFVRSCFRVFVPFFSFSVLGVCSAFGMSYNES